MNASELKLKILQELDQSSYFENGWSYLKDYADSGGKQVEAMGVLDEIRLMVRSNKDEELEDRILELMDCAYGFCQPRLRVW